MKDVLFLRGEDGCFVEVSTLDPSVGPETVQVTVSSDGWREQAVWVTPEEARQVGEALIAFADLNVEVAA